MKAMKKIRPAMQIRTQLDNQMQANDSAKRPKNPNQQKRSQRPKTKSPTMLPIQQQTRSIPKNRLHKKNVVSKMPKSTKDELKLPSNVFLKMWKTRKARC